MVFFYYFKTIQEGWCFLMKILKKELQFEKSLKQRLEFICEFAKVTQTFWKDKKKKWRTKPHIFI